MISCKTTTVITMDGTKEKAENQAPDEIPYHLVIDYMTKPVLDKIRNNDISVISVRESVSTLETVLHMLYSSGFNAADNTSESGWEKMFLRVLKDICYPLILSLHVFPSNQIELSSEKSKAFNIISRLMIECINNLSDTSMTIAVTQMFIPAVKELKYDKVIIDKKESSYFQNETEPMNLFFSLEMISAVISSPPTITKYLQNVQNINVTPEDILECLFELTLKASLDEKTFKKSSILLNKIITICPSTLQRQKIDTIWHLYCKSLHQLAGKTDHREAVWKSMYAFYCLRDHFFPLGKGDSHHLASKMNNDFWRIVQAGLVSTEPADRKLGMYLFKRLADTCMVNGCSVNVERGLQDQDVQAAEEPLFWWSPEESKKLKDVWDDFTLLIEVLEEKQVHIIRPLLPKMQKLISHSSSQSSKGLSLLHASWLVTIVTRCFQHESHYMSRWSAHTLLTLNFDQVPLIRHGEMKFLSHDLFVHLQENKLYARYEGTTLGNSSPVGEALKGFFNRLFVTLTKQQQVQYLTNVLEIVLANKWGSVPLVFLFEGLSHISPQAILHAQHLMLFRNILHACLANLEPIARGAIQCFTCHMVINLVDLNSISLWEVFDTLALLNREESLQRGSSLWSQLVDWLSSDCMLQVWPREDMVARVTQYLHSDAEEDKVGSVVFDGYQVIGLSRMLLLLADATEQLSPTERKDGDLDESIVKAVDDSALNQVLVTVTEILSAVRRRPYINTGLVDRCLALLYSLCKETSEAGKCNSQVDKMLIKRLGLNMMATVHYTQNRISTYLTQVNDLDEIKIYSDILLSLGLRCQELQPPVLELLAFVKTCLKPCVARDATPEEYVKQDVLSCAALRILASVFKMLSRNKHCQERYVLLSDVASQVSSLVKSLSLPFSRKSSSKHSVSNAQVGRVISRFISSKWQCLRYLLEVQGQGEDQGQCIEGHKVICLLEEAMEDMSVGSGASDIAIFQALEVMVPQIVVNVPTDKISQLLDMTWQKLMEEKKNILFWKKMKALVYLVLHKSFMASEDSDIEESVKQFLRKIWDFGCDKTGVAYHVLEHVCDRILVDDPGRKIATKWMSLLVDACCYGTVHKKGERLWLDVCAYLESLGPALAVNEISSSVSKNDLFTRVIVLNWISKLQPNVVADCQFVATLTEVMWTKYLHLAAQTTFKQYANSFCHREKHRMVLVLTLLSDFSEKDSCEDSLVRLWRALELECHPSVRQNLEWMTMRLLIASPENIQTIWQVFEQYNSKRSVCLCSTFIIMSHIGVHLPKDLQSSYYSKAFTMVVPWTMAHHYNTRIFAQTTMMQLWEQCKHLALEDVMTRFAVVQSSLNFILTNGNASNTSLKLITNYMYTGLEPLRDYSIETIFHTLPRLGCLADDEWVLPQQFCQIDSSWTQQSHAHHLTLYNKSPELSQCEVGPWRTKAQTENEDAIAESADGDVQKKIMPWRQMSPDQETEAEMAGLRQAGSKGGAIVVTSLIDKTTNLGGLCRTSEIFGVSEFVIGNLTHLDDRMFQTLSVSAQKWINITEVFKHRVIEYLQEKRLQGYTLVGVEQTANSVSLGQYQFPTKTLLLLGNEKEGIPVEVIQMLDVCVEIPQIGIIRSLNVHVCGALIIWEYRRQQMALQQPG